MTVPRFSVWISTRNAAPWIEKCLTSLRDQGFRDFEAVFIDDDSTDDTWLRAIRAVGGDNRFRVIVNPVRRRQVACYLQALPMFTGEIVLELDGDDWLLPDALQAISDVYEGGAQATAGQNNMSGGIPEIPRTRFWDRLAHSYAPRSWLRTLAQEALDRYYPDAYIKDCNGEPWVSAGDVALWAPICYLAPVIRGTRHPVYYVNMDNEQSDWRREGGLQRTCADAIRRRWEEILARPDRLYP